MDAVLFDMDGVLVASEAHWHAFEDDYVFAEATDGDPAHEEVTGMNYREIYDYLDREYGVRVDRAAFLAAYRERARETYLDLAEPMTGVQDALRTVRDRDVPTGVVSSARRRWIGWTLARFDLEPLDLAMSAEEVRAPGKPEPHVYEAAASRVDADPADCVVIEDSPNGIRSAVDAGTHCVAYRGASNADLDLSDASEVVDSPERLRARLDALLAE